MKGNSQGAPLHLHVLDGPGVAVDELVDAGLAVRVAGVERVDEVVRRDLVVDVDEVGVGRLIERRLVHVECRARRQRHDGFDVESRLVGVLVEPAGPAVDHHASRWRPRPADFEVRKISGEVAVEEIGVRRDARCTAASGKAVRCGQLVRVDEDRRPVPAIGSEHGFAVAPRIQAEPRYRRTRPERVRGVHAMRRIEADHREHDAGER